MLLGRSFRLLALLACLPSCKRPAPVAPTDAGFGVATTTQGDAAAPLPPRCVDAKSFGLDGTAVEYGEAVATASRVFVGATYEKGGKRHAAILSFRREGDTVLDLTTEDAGDLAPDAPPPKVALVGDTARAATYPPAKDAREIAFDGSRIKTQKDESFAFDLAVRPSGEGLIVWDEDAPAAARGVIKAAVLPYDGKVAPLVVSPDSTDAETPRVALRTGGYVVAWIARKPELVDAAPEREGPGLGRKLAWLETMMLDAKGNVVGTPSRHVRAGSRVEAFDMSSHDDTLEVLVKDDEQPADNAGSRLMLLTLRGEEARWSVVIADGVGSGVPDLLGTWAAFRDSQDQARLVPLAPGGRASTEPAFSGGRPLAALGDRILAGFPSDPARAVRLLSCGEALGKQ